MDKKFYQINFSPFAMNVLDAIERDDLITINNLPVKISRSNMDFIIMIGDLKFQTGDNLQASYILNMHEVGFMG